MMGVAVTDLVRPCDGTLRVIGLVLTAGGRAVDLALIETDGGALLRRLEIERTPITDDDPARGLAQIVRSFMGDRALQPFAIDFLALAAEAPGITALGLARALDVDVVIAPAGVGHVGFTAAERAALAAVTQYLTGQLAG